MINLTNKLVTNVKFYTSSNQPNEPVTIYTKQFDINSRYIKAVMFDGSGQKIIFPSNTRYTLNFHRSDGRLFTSSAEVQGNDIIAGFGSSMLAVAGHATCELSATYSIYTECASSHANALLVVSSSPSNNEISQDIVGDGISIGSYVYLVENIVITSNLLNVIVEESNTSDIFENILDNGTTETVINRENYDELNNAPIINADLDALAPQLAVLNKVYCHTGDSSTNYQRGMFYYSNGISWEFASGGGGGSSSSTLATLTINGETYNGSADKTINVGNVTGVDEAGDNTIVRFNGVTGKKIQSSSASIDDDGVISCAGAVVNGDLMISGDITQNGNAYETHAEQVYTKDDYIILRDGATNALQDNHYTGLEAVKYDGTHNGRLAFDKTGTAKVGDVGEEKPLATRADAEDLVDGHIVQWDFDSISLIDSGKTVDDFALREHEHSTSDIANFPTELKNPHILKIQRNGSDVASYDGSTIVTANINVPTATSQITNDSDFATNATVKPISTYFVQGTGTTAGQWLGEIDGLTEYYTGLKIFYRTNIAGATTTTLNINGLGAKTIYRYGTTKLTTHYSTNAVIPITYVAEQNSGCWVVAADYDSTDIQNLRPYYARYYTGNNPLYDYKICGEDKDGKIQPLTLETGTSTSKTVNTTPIHPKHFYWYNTTTNVAANTIINHGSLYIASGISTCAYTFNSTITTYKNIYLKGTYDQTSGLFTLDNSSYTGWYVLVPNNTSSLSLDEYFDENHQYIYLGTSYSSNNYMYIVPEHTMYNYNGDALIEYAIDTAVSNAYTLPQASANELGGVKLNYVTSDKNYAVQKDSFGNVFVHVPWTDTNTIYIHPNYAPYQSGLYKITTDDTGHIASAESVTKSDITAMGIPGDKGVTSVGITVPTGLTVNNSPITTSGNIAISLGDGYAIPKSTVGDLSVSGRTITYTKSNGTTGTIVTQDTTYTSGDGIELQGYQFSLDASSISLSSGSDYGTLKTNITGVVVDNIEPKGLIEYMTIERL